MLLWISLDYSNLPYRHEGELYYTRLNKVSSHTQSWSNVMDRVVWSIRCTACGVIGATNAATDAIIF